MRATLLLLAGLGLAGAVLASHPVQQETVAIPPGDFHEEDLELAAGAALRWEFASDQVLLYDIHSHRGGEVVTHDQGSGPAADGTFRAPAQGVYSLLLQNGNPQVANVTYSVYVEHGAPVDGSLPPPRGLPGPPAVLAPALALLAAAARRRA